MKRTGLLLIGGAVAAVGILCAVAAAPAPVPGSSEIEQLKNEVATLRQRVEVLEERAKEDLIPAATGGGHAKPGVINPYQGLRPAPQNWKKGEFNGVPYYICPLGTTCQPTSEVKKQAPHDETPALPKAVDNTIKP
jgi:hypothetical protein